MKKLFTIGYEGAQLADFLATLACHRVSVVVDVRELPLSRRKGFSKNRLAAAGFCYFRDLFLFASFFREGSGGKSSGIVPPSFLIVSRTSDATVL